MMKWKVVKNPRSSSADRSLECLKNDVQQSPQQNNADNDTNNNIGEENKPDNVQTPKETNRQRESSLVRKPSVIATECINLKSILGLTRQRSETNLSNLGLIGSEYRRSRSEVRGVSCDRLTVGYHHSAPGGNHVPNGKTRSSSPPSKSGWLRGRKRERESRNPVKNNLDVFGKTVVTGSNRKRTGSKSRNGDCRTIVDGSDSKQKSKLCPSEKSSFSDHRKSKASRRSGDEDIIEEEIYTEINQDNVRGKLLEENNKDVFKDPNRVIRKKGMAPKPQITTTIFKESNGDVNLYPTAGGSSISLNEVPHAPPNRKPPRKNQTFSCRNQDRRCENRSIQSVKMNNLKNSESALVKIKNNINAQSVVAVAEIHGESCPLDMDNENKKEVPDTRESLKSVDDVANKPPPEPLDVTQEGEEEEEEEVLPFHIDTPDYSTLDSVNCNSFSLSTEDILNCNTDCEESLQDSDNAKVSREISLSSILRDSTAENNKTDSEPKKTVRFEKLDLIEKYKRHKTETCMDTEDDTDMSVCEGSKGPLDLNSNEIDEAPSLHEDTSHCSDMQGSDEPNSMTVNVVVRSQSPAPQSNSFQGEELPTPPHFVAKKSFVLTIAKQEKGFRSLCANKKPDPIIPEPPPTPTKADQQISVTFLCSGPPSEPWVPPDRLRSTSVPPQSSLEQPTEVMAAALSAIRGRSRERKSKERQHCKKNHKARKKDAVFVMPQAVIDELSQVLEKRKPSLDEIPVHP